MDYEEQIKKIEVLEAKWQKEIERLRKKRDAIVSNYIADLRSDLITKKKAQLQ